MYYLLLQSWQSQMEQQQMNPASLITNKIRPQCSRSWSDIIIDVQIVAILMPLCRHRHGCKRSNLSKKNPMNLSTHSCTDQYNHMLNWGTIKPDSEDQSKYDMGQLCEAIPTLIWGHTLPSSVGWQINLFNGPYRQIGVNGDEYRNCRVCDLHQGSPPS